MRVVDYTVGSCTPLSFDVDQYCSITLLTSIHAWTSVIDDLLRDRESWITVPATLAT